MDSSTGVSGKTSSQQPPDINLSTATSKHLTESAKTRTIITILLLIFFYPIGVVVMWLWPKWPKVAKIIITIPVVLGIIGFIGFVIFLIATPKNIEVTLNNTVITDTAPKSNKLKNSENNDKPNPFGSLVNSQETTSSPETQTETNQETTTECKFDSECGVGKCIMIINGPNVCSEGKLGQACFLSMDCQTNHCGKGVCTEGKAGDPCDTMLGCEGSLSCEDDVCQ